MLHLDLKRLQLRPDPPDRDVTAAIDQKARVGTQAASDGVGAQSLAGAAGV
jgi:hypothetical protein